MRRDHVERQQDREDQWLREASQRHFRHEEELAHTLWLHDRGRRRQRLDDDDQVEEGAA